MEFYLLGHSTNVIKTSNNENRTVSMSFLNCVSLIANGTSTGNSILNSVLIISSCIFVNSE